MEFIMKSSAQGKVFVALKKAGKAGITEAQARRFFDGSKAVSGGKARKAISALRKEGFSIILRKNLSGASQYVLTSTSLQGRVNRTYVSRPKSIQGYHKLLAFA